MKNKCQFNKCDGSGLIPFKKNSKLIPYAWIDCECKEEPQPYQVRNPEDFDFSMSFDYYRSLCQYYGWPDPGSNRPETSPDEQQAPPQPIVNVTYQMGAHKTPAFKDLAERISRLDGRISKYFDSRKKKADKYKKYIS